MCGLPRSDDGAQLALLDAMVFFAVSSLICATMVSSVLSQADQESVAVIEGADPSETLRVFLVASVGEKLVLEDMGLWLSGREQFAEALLTVAELVRTGAPAESAAPLMSCCGAVLARLCGPAYAPALQVHCEEPVGWTVLLSTGGSWDDNTDSVSACQDFTGRGGARIVISLALSPALLPHLVVV